MPLDFHVAHDLQQGVALLLVRALIGNLDAVVGAKGKIEFLADGSCHFANALGLSLDLGERGLGLRSQRYSMLVEDGVVRKLNVEEAPGKADVSGAETMLGQL